MTLEKFIHDESPMDLLYADRNGKLIGWEILGWGEDEVATKYASTEVLSVKHNALWREYYGEDPLTYNEKVTAVHLNVEI